ncbi:MAG: hypothetical protein ACYTKD_24275 [Planctomycetota bacterium]|jgi:hypothetical protein
MRFAVLATGVCAALACAAPAEGRGRRSGRPQGKELKVGDMAPDFELVLLPEDAPDGDSKKDAAAPRKKSGSAGARKDAPAKPEKVRLSSFRGKDPVVLILSSYT